MCVCVVILIFELGEEGKKEDTVKLCVPQHCENLTLFLTDMMAPGVPTSEPAANQLLNSCVVPTSSNCLEENVSSYMQFVMC